MEEEIVLKIKKSTVLDILNLILKIYTVFLFFLALIIQSSETIIQTGIMIVVIVVFDFINDGEIILSNKGINVSSLGFTNWRNIERFDINKHIVSVKIKDEKTKKAKKIAQVWDNLEAKFGRSCFQVGTMQDPQAENKEHGQNIFY